MEINIRKNGSVLVVTVSGNIDGKTAPQLQEKLLMLVSDTSKFLLDLSHVRYMSSAGMRLLLKLQRQLPEPELYQNLVLVGLNEQIHETLETIGFAEHFEMRDTFDEGMQVLVGA